MIRCHKCGKNLSKPEKRIENAVFCIELYKCSKCGARFKMTH